MGIYEAEVRFYTELASTLDVHTPEMFWGAVEPDTGRCALVLEDLAMRATPGDMIAGGTVDQARRALAELARMQAPRWGDRSLRQHAWLADAARTQMLFDNVEPSLPMFLERFGGLLESQHIALLERLAPKASSWPRLWREPLVVMHGDYRLDNMMFNPDPDAPAVILDWQAVRLGPPLVDAAVYLGGCLDPETRREHQRGLLGEYHQHLLAAGIDGFTFDDCWHQYRWGVFWGLLLAVPMVMMLERTERGDQLFSGMVRAYADLADELGSEGLLA